MKTTDQVIKDCFRKAKVENEASDRMKYLFSLLIHQLTDHVEKVRKANREEVLLDTLEQGYSIEMDEFTILHAQNSSYTGQKDVVVDLFNIKRKTFNTVLGAMNYVETTLFE